MTKQITINTFIGTSLSNRMYFTTSILHTILFNLYHVDMSDMLLLCFYMQKIKLVSTGISIDGLPDKNWFSDLL